jgi:hypothetical protein
MLGYKITVKVHPRQDDEMKSTMKMWELEILILKQLAIQSTAVKPKCMQEKM